MGVYFLWGSLCNSGCLPALMIFKITPMKVVAAPASYRIQINTSGGIEFGLLDLSR